MTRDVIVTATLRVRAKSLDKMRSVLAGVRLLVSGSGSSNWQVEVVVQPTFEIVRAPKKRRAKR